MDFIEQINEWNKGEIVQAKIMKSEVQFIKGASIPVGLIILLLIGYGGYILYSRPLHAKQKLIFL